MGIWLGPGFQKYLSGPGSSLEDGLSVLPQPPSVRPGGIYPPLSQRPVHWVGLGHQAGPPSAHHGGSDGMWSLVPKGQAPPLPDGPSSPLPHSSPPTPVIHPSFNKSLFLLTRHHLACPGCLSSRRGPTQAPPRVTVTSDKLGLEPTICHCPSGGSTLLSLSFRLCEMGITRTPTRLLAFWLVFPGLTCSCHRDFASVVHPHPHPAWCTLPASWLCSQLISWLCAWGSQVGALMLCVTLAHFHVS